MNISKKILVLCTGNSCRSQIAEGYLRHFAGEKALVYSAGIETHGVNPKVVAIMAADGIDISHQTSNNVLEYENIEFDFIITVCDHALENCPVLKSNALRFHSNFPDPSKIIGHESLVQKEFEAVQLMIKKYCSDFVDNNIT